MITPAALIYDDLFRQVRVWARLGYSPSSIQDCLDARYAPIHEVLSHVKSRPALPRYGRSGQQLYRNSDDVSVIEEQGHGHG